MKLLNKIKKRLLYFIYKFMKPKLHIIEALLSGDGSFVDIRYWISKPSALNPRGDVFLTDKESGNKLFLLRVAKIGAVRTRHNKRNTTGVLLFYNKDGLVKSGSKVSLCLDSLVAEGEVK